MTVRKVKVKQKSIVYIKVKLNLKNNCLLLGANNDLNLKQFFV